MTDFRILKSIENSTQLNIGGVQTIPNAYPKNRELISFNSTLNSWAYTGPIGLLLCDENNNTILGSSGTSTGNGNVIVGCRSGLTGFTNNNNIIIGHEAGITDDGNNRIAIGKSAGQYSQQTNSIAIGTNAGRTSQKTNSIAIGRSAGRNSQSSNSIALGVNAGRDNQDVQAVAVGFLTGIISQGPQSVAIGGFSGQYVQGEGAVAIGAEAGQTNQGYRSVAIGYQAGKFNQGTGSIAIGTHAGATNQHNNSIIINASGGILDSVGPNKCQISPMDTGTINNNVVGWNPVTKELFYDPGFSGGGGGGGGDVVGPSSSTDNALVRFDSTTGKIIQDQANVTLGDTGIMSFSSTAEIRFLELAVNGTNYMGIKAPDAISSSATLILPDGLPSVTKNVIVDSSGNISYVNPRGTVPSLTMEGYDRDELAAYVRSTGVNGSADLVVNTYAHGTTPGVTNGYWGSVYSPFENKIYFVPYDQGNQTNWHYIDCNNGTVKTYAHGVTAGTNAYRGGVYSPKENRIYLVPYGQSDETNWHYIDCDNGTVNAYAHGVTVLNNGYEGGCYSKTEDRIYFAPVTQRTETNWHYIDCTDGSVNTYTHAGYSPNGSSGGAIYSPSEDRIYFIPHTETSNVGYINCATSTVSSIIGSGLGSIFYKSGVFSPTQNRIYFIPYTATTTSRAYIDCDTGTCISWTGLSMAGGTSTRYLGGVYSPTQDRIWYVPFGHSDDSTWYYLDCSDGIGTEVAYTHGLSLADQAYAGGTYSPTEDRVYFCPWKISTATDWHFMSHLGHPEKVAISLMGGPLFNNL